MAGIAKTLQWIATCILLHTAYSTYDYLSQLKALDRPQDSLPSDVTLEGIFALVLFILSSILASPPLVKATWADEMEKRSINEMDSRLGFAGFKHRGAAFFGSH
ncbi:hypothetical protein CPB86DRAFT_754250 [Serendipita vermifera]|nr:hypothetical protein CPB86DRAFT_754250 [Serendipita vermifera]